MEVRPMSSRYAPLTDRQLITALRRRLWREYGAGEVLPRILTSDLENYLCVVVDLADGAVREDAPPFSSPSARDAVEGMLGYYEDKDVAAGLAAGDALPDVATLADPFPTARVPGGDALPDVATLADPFPTATLGDAPYTVQVDPAELGADAREAARKAVA
jgi:hypothetical protein